MLGEAVRALFTARWHAAGALQKTFFLPLPLRQPGSTTVSLCQSLPMLLGTVHQILVNESGCLRKGCKINIAHQNQYIFLDVFLCRYNHFRLGVTEMHQKCINLTKIDQWTPFIWLLVSVCPYTCSHFAFLLICPFQTSEKFHLFILSSLSY